MTETDRDAAVVRDEPCFFCNQYGSDAWLLEENSFLLTVHENCLRKDEGRIARLARKRRP